MPRLTDVMNDSWREVEVTGESIPHLLHWDLAYLWVLQKPRDLRPKTWENRVRAWKGLFARLLLGQLELSARAITDPLLSFTSPYGISSALELKSRGNVVGVSSPIVICRPLPDLDPAAQVDLTEIERHKSELSFCLQLLVGSLRSLTSSGDERQIQHVLLAVLESLLQEWGGLAGVSYQTEVRQTALLRSVSFADPTQQIGIDQVELHISKGLESKTYVPRCRECDGLLTRKDDDPQVEVEERFVIQCPKCSVDNEIDLARLFLWQRTSHEMIHWTERRGDLFATDPTDQYPPAYTLSVQGQFIRFEWAPADVGNSPSRFLSIKFKDRTVAAKSFRSDAMYDHLLVKGGAHQHFSGLPIRHEFSCSVRNKGNIKARPDSLVFGPIQLAGLPFRIEVTRGTLSVTVHVPFPNCLDKT